MLLASWSEVASSVTTVVIGIIIGLRTFICLCRLFVCSFGQLTDKTSSLKSLSVWRLARQSIIARRIKQWCGVRCQAATVECLMSVLSCSTASWEVRKLCLTRGRGSSVWRTDVNRGVTSVEAASSVIDGSSRPHTACMYWQHCLLSRHRPGMWVYSFILLLLCASRAITGQLCNNVIVCRVYSWNGNKPPFNFDRGQDDIVWISPQGHTSVAAWFHFFLQAPRWPCAVRKRFSRSHSTVVMEDWNFILVVHQSV